MGDFYYEVSLAEAGDNSFTTIRSCLFITKRHNKNLILLTEKKHRL